MAQAQDAPEGDGEAPVPSVGGGADMGLVRDRLEGLIKTIEKERIRLSGELAKWSSVEATLSSMADNLRKNAELRSQVPGMDRLLASMKGAVDNARGIVQSGPTVLLQQKASLQKTLKLMDEG